MLRLAILGSTRGTNMLPVIEAIHNKTLSARIEVVISDKKDAIILDRARSHGIQAVFINPQGLQRAEYDRLLSDTLERHDVDLVVLIGYMKILSPEFTRHWHNKVINIHPSLLPAFAGLMDLAVHQAVIDAQVPETGCTIHYVTEEVDAGPIVLQKKCSVDTEDTPETLKAKVQKLESLGLIEAIARIESSYHCF